jgi:hypothetical protein
MDDLAEKIAAFRARHEMSASEFGKRAINSSSLIPSLEEGRQLRKATVARIVNWMEAYDVGRDEKTRSALDAVRTCGFVIVDPDGNPRLTSHTQIDREAFSRLVATSQLVPNGDAMFDCPSQTYRPA